MRALRFAIVALSWLVLLPSASAAQDDPDARVLRVERWLKAVLRHEPGETDDATREVAAWSNAFVRALQTDEYVLTQLMRNPGISSIKFPGQTSRLRPTPFPYTDWQIRRLRVLACAAAGILGHSDCVRIDAESEVDDGLKQLASAAKASRSRGDDNYVLRRGALLHTDVAMSAPRSLEPPDTSGTGGASHLVVHSADGRETSVGQGGTHWEIARMLLDAVKAETPGPDDMTRRWYIATAAWMQKTEQHDTEHLKRARAMFPGDADIQFLSGCQQEVYASPSVQSLVRSAVLPTGISLDVPKESVALRDAEDLFRRAVTLNPRASEAHLRLGHVLLARGKPREAVEELARADNQNGDPVLHYYAALFLGAAQEALGQLDEARDSYARAARMAPRAQSPYLALSALSMRRGDRAGAVRELEPMLAFAPEPFGRDDPWWIYYAVQARNADRLLEQLYESVAAAER
jgi:tetratricopeptide (TPR) repeat protein